MQRQFNFQPSRYLVLALAVMHGVAWVSLLLLALPAWADAALFGLLAVNLLHHVSHKSWLTARPAGIAMQLDEDKVIVTERNGRQVAGKVLPDSIIAPLLTIVNFLPQGSRSVRSVVILPDSLDTDSFRQLRVGLRWGG